MGTAYYNTTHLSAGFHTIESTEKYLVYITGITNNSAYGYTVAMKCKFESNSGKLRWIAVSKQL